KGARLVVIIAPALQADRLGYRDLDMVDVRAVPQRLEHRIGEAQRQQVLNCLLAQIMVDAENAVFGEMRRNRVVDFAAGFEIGPQRLLEGHPHGRASEPRRRQSIDGRLEQRRRGRKENGYTGTGVTDRTAKPFEIGRVGDVDRHIMKPLEKAVRDPLAVKALWQMLMERFVRALAQACVVELGSSRADDPEFRRKKSI